MSNQINDTLPTPEGQEENGRDAADYLSFRPGQRLRKARELRGMSIEQVARELALTPRYVEAMETDSYKSLPEPAFVRGYMRRYAQLVKLSADDIAAKFDQCYAEDKETPALEVRPQNPIQLLGELARRPRKTGRLLSWLGLLFILVMVAGFLWNGFRSHGTLPVAEEPAASAPEAAAPVAPVAPAVPETAVPVAPAVPAEGAPATGAPATTMPAPAPSVPAPVPTPAPAPAPAVPSAPATSTPGMSVLPAPASPPVLPAPGGALRSVPAPAPALPVPAPQPAPARR